MSATAVKSPEFKALRKKIRCCRRPDLNLKNMSLGLMDWIEFLEAFGSIPVYVTNLDLSLNHLGNRSVLNLERIFKLLPKGLTSLDLSFNDLNSKSDRQLVQILRALPQSLTRVNASNFLSLSCGRSLYL